VDSHSRWLLQNNGEPAHALELSDTTRPGVEQSLDFDHWRQLGNQGWAWSDVLPYFKKAESWQGGASDIRGGDGPLSVSNTRFTHPIIDSWVEAATSTGYETTADYNGAQQDGVGYYQMTTRNGRRCSTAVAYLRPVRNRKNLDVITDAKVQCLRFDGRRTCGVSALVKGHPTTLTAKREVVLCAGAIASPRLLLLSRIGSLQGLVEHNINVHHELPGVGENLQDHLQARAVLKCQASTMNLEVDTLSQEALVALRYALSRSGPM